MFPKTKQIAAYEACGYLVASTGSDTQREQFERWCEFKVRPLVIIWPPANRRRSVTLQLFNCTTSILDEEFRAQVQTLARIWMAPSYQTESLPVSFVGMTLRRAQALAGYLHEPAIRAYKRRAERVRSIIIVTEGPASDGKPKKCGGGCVFPVKGQREYTCILQLDNGERFKGGFIGTKEPEREFIVQQFSNEPSMFRLLTAANKLARNGD